MNIIHTTFNRGGVDVSGALFDLAILAMSGVFIAVIAWGAVELVKTVSYKKVI